MDMVAPVCPRIFGCTAYEASIHQHAVRVIFAEYKAHVDGVTQIANQPRDLLKSSSSGQFNWLHKKEMAVLMSGHPRWLRYSPCITRWMNNSFFSFHSHFGLSVFILNRCVAAGVAACPSIDAGASLSMFLL